MVKISTRDADRILLSLFEVADDRTATFLERLKQLRHLGVPSGVPKGRGTRSGRTLEQMVELALAVHLIDAGLSSAHVARLLRTEWSLASAALAVFQWPEVRDVGGTPLGKAEPYWLAEPVGLAEYRSKTNPLRPRLATIVLFEGERLQDKIAEWAGRRSCTVAAIRAAEVVRDLLAKYREIALVSHAELQMALAQHARRTAETVLELRAEKTGA